MRKWERSLFVEIKINATVFGRNLHYSHRVFALYDLVVSLLYLEHVHRELIYKQVRLVL